MKYCIAILLLALLLVVGMMPAPKSPLFESPKSPLPTPCNSETECEPGYILQDVLDFEVFMPNLTFNLSILLTPTLRPEPTPPPTLRPSPTPSYGKD